jgi:hypothetical protein
LLPGHQKSTVDIDGHKVGARGDEGAAASVGLERTSIIVFESCLLMISSRHFKLISMSLREIFPIFSSCAKAR